MKNIKAVLTVAAVILAARVAGATEKGPAAPVAAPTGCAVARATVVAADGTIHIISRTVCVVAR